MIHYAFLGTPFTRTVTDRCEPMTCPLSRPDASNNVLRPWRYLIAVLGGIGCLVTYVYLGDEGLFDTGKATVCLCHLEGDCMARVLGKLF